MQNQNNEDYYAKALEEKRAEEQNEEIVLEADSNLPKKPEIPVLMFLFAAIKDVLDVVLTIFAAVSIGLFAVFTIPVGFVISLFFAVVIGVWVSQKAGIIRKFLFKRVIIKTILFFFIGIIPLFKVLPEATLLVLLTYLNEVRIVNKLYSNKNQEEVEI